MDRIVEAVKQALSQIVHPETGRKVNESIIGVEQQQDKLLIRLSTDRKRDPFEKSLRARIVGALSSLSPSGKVEVIFEQREQEEKERVQSTDTIGRIVAVASGKGGVGKSTVAANMAVTLRNMGYRVGLLDADIYGPSQPTMFGCEGYHPAMEEHYGLEFITPWRGEGITLMSIGFFIGAGDALIWRGPMATNALKQLIHQTWWGEIDFLLVDLPPGTGDVHLSVIQEMKIDGAVIVTTPQRVSVADVRRGIKMFEAPKIDIKVLGIVENMAWFTPEELPNNRYYIFGRGGGAALADEEGVPFLGEIPIVESIAAGADKGVAAVKTEPIVEKAYREICAKIVEKLG